MSSWRDFDVHGPVQRRHRNTCAQNGLPGSQLRFILQVMAFNLKVRMFGEPNPQIQIAGGSPALPGFTTARYSQPLTISNSSRNFYLVGIGFRHLSGAAAY